MVSAPVIKSPQQVSHAMYTQLRQRTLQMLEQPVIDASGTLPCSSSLLFHRSTCVAHCCSDSENNMDQASGGNPCWLPNDASTKFHSDGAPSFHGPSSTCSTEQFVGQRPYKRRILTSSIQEGGEPVEIWILSRATRAAYNRLIGAKLHTEVGAARPPDL